MMMTQPNQANVPNEEKCLKHGLTNVSREKSTGAFLCNTCIYECESDNLEFLPQIGKQLQAEFNASHNTLLAKYQNIEKVRPENIDKTTRDEWKSMIESQTKAIEDMRPLIMELFRNDSNLVKLETVLTDVRDYFNQEEKQKNKEHIDDIEALNKNGHFAYVCNESKKYKALDQDLEKKTKHLIHSRKEAKELVSKLTDLHLNKDFLRALIKKELESKGIYKRQAVSVSPPVNRQQLLPQSTAKTTQSQQQNTAQNPQVNQQVASQVPQATPTSAPAQPLPTAAPLTKPQVAQAATASKPQVAQVATASKPQEAKPSSNAKPQTAEQTTVSKPQQEQASQQQEQKSSVSTPATNTQLPTQCTQPQQQAKPTDTTAPATPASNTPSSEPAQKSTEATKPTPSTTSKSTPAPLTLSSIPHLSLTPYTYKLLNQSLYKLTLPCTLALLQPLPTPHLPKLLSLPPSLYLLGGSPTPNSPTPLPDFSSLTPGTPTLTALPPMLTARHSFSLGTSSDHEWVYVVGGMGEGKTVLDKCEVFSIKGNKWVSMPDLNRGLCSSGMCVYRGKDGDEWVYVVGGVLSGDRPEVSGEILRVKKGGDKWESVGEMPYKACDVAVVQVGEDLVVLGGWDKVCIKRCCKVKIEESVSVEEIEGLEKEDFFFGGEQVLKVDEKRICVVGKSFKHVIEIDGLKITSEALKTVE